MPTLPIEVAPERISAFCQANHIAKLSLFGSILTDRFRPTSDIDLLVEFEPGGKPTLLGLARMERELTDIFGRQVDLRGPDDLSRYFSDEVLATALPLYDRR